MLRELLTVFVNTLLSAEADAVCGAAYGTTSPERVNRRNGYRAREFDTRAGTVELAVPKLRTGSYFPEWLLERRKRAERALTSVVATCYLLGVSTRRMDKLVASLGITSLSKSDSNGGHGAFPKALSMAFRGPASARRHRPKLHGHDQHRHPRRRRPLATRPNA